MSARIFALALPIVAPLVIVGGVAAQDAPRPYDSLDALKASYSKQLLDLDRRKLADLAALAASQKGEEAEATYRELFGLAVARDLYVDAEPAAVQYLKTGSEDAQDRAIAALVSVIAKANRGEYDASLAQLKNYYEQTPVAPDPNLRLQPGTALAIGEAYLQELIRAGRYDIAKKVCEMVVARRPEPEIKQHFGERLARFNMLGKVAPAIAGKDVDGRAVALADYKGKVVLIDFWATWCPPCHAMVPQLKALQDRHGADGFVVLGVNLDAHHDDADDLAKSAEQVKKFILDARASWPNVLVGPPSPNDPPSAYGVEEIPASFLVGRDGTVIQVELTGPELDKAIAEALKR